ncbi:MAG: tetratricopeptide repeat protein [Proteobacteria bacterium]|nr:tetratricopeptide repeat protein [Pseudomonadota bacterium]
MRALQDHAETAEQSLLRAQAEAQAGRLESAREICGGILDHAPGHPGATALLGMIAARAGRFAEAADLLERAVRANPGLTAARSSLAAAYQKLCRMPEALREAAAAVAAQPTSTDSLVTLAMVQIDLDQHEQAKISLMRAIGNHPDAPEPHLGLAQVLLAQGEMAPGWIEYEWRNRMNVAHNTLPRITSPYWNGMRIPTGRILLIGDQGYGDSIQFARYIPLVTERCRDVVLGCSAELAPLLSDVPGVGQCFSRWDAIPPHAAHCRLSSLPLMFGTTVDTIPAKHPYLAADPQRVAAWRDRLGPRWLPRIGLAWSGRPTHPNDLRRSVALHRLAPLSSARPAQFVCLQKPLPPSDEAALAAFPGMIDLSDALADFGETAALIENLDLVVSVDSAVAHLAGALGKPCWLLLSKAADWRWMVERSDSPWYPTIRLFRQHIPGAWDDLVQSVRDALVQGWDAPATEGTKR